MGLDIVAYSKIKFIGNTEFVSSDLYINTNNEFTQHGTLADGYYEYDNEYSFRAGSYSGYNDFRKDLAVVGGYTVKRLCYAPEAYRNHPFFDMVYFTDCDGVICSEICEKLYKEFVEYHHKASGILSEWYMNIYNNFMEAFKIGADNGCVVFC